MIRLRLLSEDECKHVEFVGTPPTIEIRYGGQTRRAVLEQCKDYSFDWEPVEVEYVGP